MKDDAKRESSVNAAESKTLSMRGSSMRENRETPAMPSAGGGVGRPEKAASPTSGMHVAGVSVFTPKWAIVFRAIGQV